MENRPREIFSKEDDAPDPQPRFLMPTRFFVGVSIVLAGLLLTIDRLHLLEVDRVQHYGLIGLMAIGGLMVILMVMITLMIMPADVRVGYIERGFRRPDFGTGVRFLLARVLVFNMIADWMFQTLKPFVPWGFRSFTWLFFWPIIFVVIFAVMMLWPGGILTRMRRRNRQVHEDVASGGRGDSSAVSIFSVMSGVHRAVNTTAFRGGTITTFMGGVLLDLRSARLAPGEDATVDITAFTGSVEIVVPPNWVVVNLVSPFMGNIEDNRLPSVAVNGTMPAFDETTRLVLRGFAMMSSVEVRN
ncbi:MAG: LiaF-related protein [Acidobacteriaceae bacterium]|jgi:predicted membrane protein|nr:LiaF-related protein [Acidobacteriaceae bacterium]